MKVGTLDGDILQIFVPAGNFPSDIMLRHSEDFAVAAEYVLPADPEGGRLVGGLVLSARGAAGKPKPSNHAMWLTGHFGCRRSQP